MLPFLISARAVPGTLCVDMRRSISASAVPELWADSEGATVTTAAQTAHIASRRPHRFRVIVLGPMITIKFRKAHPAGGGRSRQDGVGFCSRLRRRVAFRGCITLAPMVVTGAKLAVADNRLAVEAQIRSLRSNPLRLGMQPSLTLYWL